MAPRILTWEDKVDEKIREITMKRLEVRIHFRENKKLFELKSFKRDMSYQFYLKNEELKEKLCSDSKKLIDEIDRNQQEIDNFKQEAAEISKKLETMAVKESILCGALSDLKKELRVLLNENAQQNN